jgi:hypothetical protein
MDIKHYEDIALSNTDILSLLHGKASIVLYPNLYKYNNIDDILGPYGACVLLFEAKPSYGHWVCIFKINETTLEFFNPYGGFPDDSLNYIPDDFKALSHQNYPILSKLLLISSYELTYNEHQFQQKNKDIRTCGRHCVVRLLHRHLSLEEYVDFLNNACQKFNLNYDGIVTLLTVNKNIKY